MLRGCKEKATRILANFGALSTSDRYRARTCEPLQCQCSALPAELIGHVGNSILNIALVAITQFRHLLKTSANLSQVHRQPCGFLYIQIVAVGLQNPTFRLSR